MYFSRRWLLPCDIHDPRHITKSVKARAVSKCQDRRSMARMLVKHCKKRGMRNGAKRSSSRRNSGLKSTEKNRFIQVD